MAFSCSFGSLAFEPIGFPVLAVTLVSHSVLVVVECCIFLLVSPRLKLKDM